MEIQIGTRNFNVRNDNQESRQTQGWYNYHDNNNYRNNNYRDNYNSYNHQRNLLRETYSTQPLPQNFNRNMNYRNSGYQNRNVTNGYRQYIDSNTEKQGNCLCCGIQGHYWKECRSKERLEPN